MLVGISVDAVLDLSGDSVALSSLEHSRLILIIFSFCCMSWCENHLPYKFCLVSLCFIPSFWFLISPFTFDSHLYIIYMLYIYIFLKFFLRINSGNHHLNQFEEYNPVVFSIFTVLYNHHHHLIPEDSYHLKKTLYTPTPPHSLFVSSKRWSTFFLYGFACCGHFT